MKKRPSSGIWPDSHWESLFLQAADLLAERCPGAYWTFGGGTALAQRYRHRVSYDVDIFLHDVQIVSYLTPRTNDVAASLATSYEESANGVKIVTEYGDIDFVAAADVTEVVPETMLVQGRETRVQAPAEILAKRIQYRGYQFAHRDIFDLAMLMEQDAKEVEVAISFCGSDAIEKTAGIIAARLPSLTAELPQYVNPTRSFVPLVDRAADIVIDFPEVRRRLSSRSTIGKS